MIKIKKITVADILQNMADDANVSKTIIEKDFIAFNNAIDELIEHGLSEDEAILKVCNTWTFDFNR